MEVGAVGDGSPNPPDALARPAVAPHARAVVSAPLESEDDGVASSLQNLANPRISELLDLFENARLAQDPAALDALLQAAASAPDLSTAMRALTELMTLNPQRGAEMIRDSRALDPMRSEVNELLSRLELDAKLHAENLLAAVSLALENGTLRSAAGVDPQDLLALAQRFAESGQYMNYVRAAELCNTVIAFYADQPAPLRGKRAAVPPRNPRRSGTLWRRAPVLVLLLAWLCLGLGGWLLLPAGQETAAVTIWGTGFLVLVVFQFLATIRNARF